MTDLPRTPAPALPDPAAVPRARHDAPEVTEADLVVLREQLGRPARGVVGVAARCACGRPLVVRTAPRLDDGTPFPTTYKKEKETESKIN